MSENRMEVAERDDLPQRPGTPKLTVDQQQYREGEFGSGPQSKGDDYLQPSEDDPYSQHDREPRENRGVNFETQKEKELGFQGEEGMQEGRGEHFYRRNKNQKFQDKVRQQYNLVNMPLHRAPWNERFFLSSVQNNGKTHPFFKEYFDKPSKQKKDILLKPEKPEIPIEDFYRSSSLAQLLFNSPKLKKSLKKREILRESLKETMEAERPQTKGSTLLRRSLESQHGHSTSQKNFLINEFNWCENFNVMASKNNVQVHRNYQEFFDRPINYDVKGYLYSQKPDPFLVYNEQTPFYKNITSKKPMSAQMMNRAQSQQVLQRPAHTSQGQRPVTVSDKRALTQNQHFIIKHASQSQRSKRPNKGFGPWNNRIGLPISTYNEKVYPKYKITFEHLSRGMLSI